MIKIDKDVAPPISKVIGLTLSRMQVGDSFLLGDNSFKARQLLSRKARELKNKMFTSAREGDGIRTWRIA